MKPHPPRSVGISISYSYSYSYNYNSELEHEDIFQVGFQEEHNIEGKKKRERA